MNKLNGPQGNKPSIIIPDFQKPKSPEANKPKKNSTDKYIDEILDKWEKEHPNWRDKDKKDEDGLSK